MSSGERRGYLQSWAQLQSLGFIEPGKTPQLPGRRPDYDDEELIGVRFFRTQVSGNLSNMTLSRTYFGRTDVRGASFSNTDLSESTLCWTDFYDVDFGYSCLRGSDLRASVFFEVNFAFCDLRDADLRQSTFERCDFTGANLLGAKFANSQWDQIDLADPQRAAVSWEFEDGPEPGGG